VVQARTESVHRDPSATDREWLETLTMTEGTLCANCHDQINPPGFALEGFDGLGRVRVGADTHTEIDGVEVDGLRDLEEVLLRDGSLALCLGQHAMHRALASVSETGPSGDAEARHIVATLSPERPGALDLRALLVEVAASDALRMTR
jgi:hypothetical protein